VPALSSAQRARGCVLQVVCSLLLSEEHLAGCPGVVAEDIARRAHRLRNDMFVMGGKIQGKPLLPLPEHLDGHDGTRTVLEWWVLGRTGSCGGSGDGGPFLALRCPH